ncbi:hypothetical protein DL764_005987 [Monosporascus ibericus]|uniref:ubiquitinyl hydrolase 1 n=1 Tax=Monosporascus ibericus TaxID=155417 RepID=A0A4V1XAA0_9PEZI|nr:hypothetical protein DL764_005987 [Monosporascus ibericus]
MFEPQPTPFAQFTRPSYGVTITNAGTPEYEFPPTSLGQGQLFVNVVNGGCGGGLGVASAVSATASANSRTAATAAIFASPAFHSSQVAAVNNNNNSTTSTTAHLLPHQEQQLPADGHNNHPHHHQHNNSPHILKAHYQDAHGPYPPPHHTTQPQQHHHQHRRQLQQHPQQQQQQQKRLKMEQSPTSDISQQQAAARDYKPVLEGPMVGEKTTSHAITQEYAKADRTYVAKTLALPQTYSHFRPIQGDGNCGWRAIGFAYFEALGRCGDIARVQAELARLQRLNEFIENVGGISPWVFEDMISETFDLFREIAVAMSSGQDCTGPLMAKFNDISSSQYIVYHLRLLAASWLRGNSAEFQPYLAVDINNYIEATVMPVDQEIDAICVRVLVDVLLKPANMVLEIAYLDRSEGAEVNVHRMPEEANGQNLVASGSIIYLLYRPGHYDILYRDPVLQHPPTPTAPISLEINRVSFAHQQEIQSSVPSLQDFTTLDMSPLTMLPAFEPTGVSPLVPPQPASPMPAAYVPPQSPWIPQPFPEPMQAPAPVPAQPSPPQQQPTTPITTHPLRFSKWNFPDLPEMAENAASYEPTFTTNSFKNSHYNVAHYSNNNFQPEMYRPEAEEAAVGRSGPRKRSTDSAGIRKNSRG